MIGGRTPPTPGWATAAHAFLLGAAVWGYFVAFHEIARALVGGFGSPPTEVALAVVGSLIGALPLLALLPIALLPRWWFGFRLPERRLAAAKCPDCAYPCREFPCPECGGDGRVTRLELFTRGPIVALLIGAAAMFTLAITWAEFRVRQDEALFQRQVEIRVASGQREPFARPREGWGSFATLRYDPASGFDAPPPFDHPRIPGWRAPGRSALAAP